MSHLVFRLFVACVTVALATTNALALTVTCGMTIPSGSGRVDLDGDVTCADGHTAAVTVQGPGTSLNLGGHSIKCDGMTVYGIVLSGSGAAVENGRVQDYQTAGVVLGGSGGVVSNVVVTGSGIGFDVSGGAGNAVVACTAVGQNIAGIRTVAPSTVITSNRTNCPGIGYFIDTAATNSVLKGNTAARANTAGFHFAADGIVASKNSAIANETGFEVVAGSGIVLKKNTAIGNSGTGFTLIAGSATLSKNVAKGNGTYGINVEGSNNILAANQSHVNGADGIRVLIGPTNNVFSGNAAYGNANFDLEDEDSCAGATWTKSKFGTASDSCIH